MVYLVIDNRKCKDNNWECFDNTKDASEFIVASMRKGWEAGVKIGTITCKSPADTANL
jgi:hypothetical protein